MKSRITGRATRHIFTATMLHKYPVKFFRCEDTGFIQTEEPYWLSEAYSSAIAELDVGIISRNLRLADVAEKVIGENFNAQGRFLDHAGGFGILTRTMRDRGYDFHHTDKYCDNLFAKHFTLEDLPTSTSFELVTAFEVFEHLVDPLDEIAKLFEYSGSLLFSTVLLPRKPITSASDWWYFAPDTGQHVSFYTQRSLQWISEKLGAHLQTNNAHLHLLTKRRMDHEVFRELSNAFGHVTIRRPRFSAIPLLSSLEARIARALGNRLVYERQSYLESDYQRVLSMSR